MKSLESPTPVRAGEKTPAGEPKTDFAFIRKVVVESPAQEGPRGFFRGLMERFRKGGEVRSQEKSILAARRELGSLGVSVADLNRKIERLDKIAARWKAKGEILDLKT